MYISGSLSSFIEELNEKLNAFTAEYTDNAISATIILISLLIFSYWAIGYFSKK